MMLYATVRNHHTSIIKTFAVAQAGFVFFCMGWISDDNVDEMLRNATRNNIFMIGVCILAIYHILFPIGWVLCTDTKKAIVALVIVAGVMFIGITVYTIVYESYFDIVIHVMYQISTLQAISVYSMMYKLNIEDINNASMFCYNIIINTMQSLMSYLFAKKYPICIPLQLAIIYHYHILFIFKIATLVPTNKPISESTATLLPVDDDAAWV